MLHSFKHRLVAVISVVLAAMPLAATGKIDKVRLRADYAARRLSEAA